MSAFSSSNAPSAVVAAKSLPASAMLTRAAATTIPAESFLIWRSLMTVTGITTSSCHDDRRTAEVREIRPPHVVVLREPACVAERHVIADELESALKAADGECGRAEGAADHVVDVLARARCDGERLHAAATDLARLRGVEGVDLRVRVDIRLGRDAPQAQV